MSDFTERIAEILKTELSSITVNGLISYCAWKIGKRPDSLVKEDIPAFSNALLQSIFFLSDAKKAERITEKLRRFTA